MPSLKSLLLSMAAAAAAAMAAGPPLKTGDAHAVVAPAEITAAAQKPPIKCDYAYCDNGTSWCFYFAGFTTFDPTRGPLPGETRTSIGPCGTKAAEADGMVAKAFEG